MNKKAQLGDIDTYVTNVVNAQIAYYQTPNQVFLSTYDPTADLIAVKVPMLELFGELDVQVRATLNSPALETIINENQKTNIEVQLIPLG